MVQIIDSGGTLLGRIGAGVGKGLSEQVPKEVDRYRLSSGLKNLEGRQLSPLQQSAELIKSGASTEQINQLLPLVRQHYQTQALLNQTEGDRNAQSAISRQNQSAQESAPSREIEPQMGNSKFSKDFATPDQIAEQKQRFLQEPTFQQKQEAAAQFLRSGQVLDPSEAMKLGAEQLRENLKSQQEKSKALVEDVTNRMKLDLQGTGLGDYKDIAGEIQNSLLDQAKYDVFEKGMSPEAAADKVSKVMRDLAKAGTQVKTTGALKKIFASSKEKSRALNEQKAIYDKYGYGEIFNDLAADAMGITPMQAAGILNPIKNKAVNKDLSDLKRGKIFHYGTSEIPEKSLKKIVDNIKPTDNILSIANSIRDKKFDVHQFLTAVSEKEGLTEEQIRQINKPSSQSRTYGDILYQTF